MSDRPSIIDEKWPILTGIRFWVMFLAVMSSSRSDGVTQFACPCFRVSVPFFLLVSLEAVVFQGSFKGV